ncbi:MAG: sensor histidine kinase [Planctomycetes bacterium]|nr:sensor histidine kinase [Planctomycetota bacterium]
MPPPHPPSSTNICSESFVKSRPRIFEPFYSTKTCGIGLGLSISRSIVENHRGTLTLASTAPCGAEFVIRLPPTGGNLSNFAGCIARIWCFPMNGCRS